MLHHNPELYVQKWLWAKTRYEEGTEYPNPVFFDTLLGREYALDRIDPKREKHPDEFRELLINRAFELGAGHGFKVAAAFAAYDRDSAEPSPK